jgi:hypothetical protein
MAYAKLKAHLQKAAARTVEALRGAMASAIRHITRQDCLGYFAAAGHGSA